MSSATRADSSTVLTFLLLSTIIVSPGSATSIVPDHLGQLQAVSVYVNAIADVSSDERLASQLEELVTSRLQLLAIDVVERGEASLILEVRIERGEAKAACTQFVAVSSTLRLRQQGLVGQGNAFYRVADGVISWDRRSLQLVSADLLDVVLAEQVESMVGEFSGGVAMAKEVAAQSRASPPR